MPILALLLRIQVQTFPQNAETSTNLYNTFIGRGFKTNYQGLCPSQSEIYPRNVIVNIPAAANAVRPENTLDTIFLIFSQRDASENQESFVEFAEKLEAAWQPFTIKIVLAANEDIRELPGSEEFEHPAGISIFSQSLDSGSNCCAIIAKTSFRNRISQGGGGTVAPIWLVKSIKDSCEESSVSAWLPNSASFLYRLGFMGEDSNISPFLSDSIPAAGLYLDDMEDCLSILTRTLEKLSAAGPGCVRGR